MDSAIIDIVTATLDSQSNLYTDSGTAFFIYEDYAITTASLLIFQHARQPYTSNYIQRVQRIDGTIRVDGIPTSVSFDLVGISPVNNIGVIVLKNKVAHAVVPLGSSRQTKPGTKVYTIGNLLNQDMTAISTGMLRNNRLSYIADPNVAELIDTDIALGGGMAGAPILTEEGLAIGMVSVTLNWLQASGYLLSTGTTLGISQYTFQQVFSQIVEGRYCQAMRDSLGTWLRWMPTTLGCSFSYIQPPDVVTLSQGLASTITNADTATVASPLVLSTVRGAMITSILPGASIGNYLYAGDIVETVFDNPIGYFNDHMSISTALWEVVPGSPVNIQARLKSEGYRYVRNFLVGTSLLPPQLDVVYSDVQTLSTDIVNEPSNLARPNPVPAIHLYAAMVLPSSPINGKTLPLATYYRDNTVTFEASHSSIFPYIATLKIPGGPFSIQVSGLSAGNYHISLNNSTRTVSNIEVSGNSGKEIKQEYPLIDTVIVPALGTITIDWHINGLVLDDYYIVIDRSGITTSEISVFNFIPGS